MNPQKIARLPQHLRQEINLRLESGENPIQIAAWIQSLPEGKEIRVAQEDVAAWKEDGYRLWLSQQSVVREARRVADEARELNEVAKEPLTDHLATWLAGRYAAATRRLSAESADGAADWEMLRAFCHDLVSLRRGDYNAEWLKIEQARVKMEKARQKDDLERLFLKWAKNNPEKLPQEPKPPPLTDKEKQQKMRAIFGID